jgi:2-methylcitrate dehydratase
MSWEEVEAKFESLAGGRYDEAHRDRIVETVHSLEQYDVTDLVALLR